MLYKSQINVIWAKLSTEGSPRRPTTFRTSFNNIVTVFTQAENGKYSGSFSSDVAKFRAEYNVWAYYFGEEVPFPGLDPATGQMAAVPPQVRVALFSREAANMQEQIQTLWTGRWNRIDYQPQMGWNPETGEPWMAVRAYAVNSYPALSGNHNCYLKALREENPEFVVQYERFPQMGYTLIWPEFANVADLKNQAIWKRFGQLRAFLSEWSSIVGMAPHIDNAFGEYRLKPEDERPGLPIPEGFVLNTAQIYSDNQRRFILPRRGLERERCHRREDSLQRKSTTDRFGGREAGDERRRYSSRNRATRHDRSDNDCKADRFKRSRSYSPRY